MIYKAILLSLDLSTTCTGWAVFDMQKKDLIESGRVKPKVKGVSKMKYPEKQIRVMRDLAEKIFELIKEYNPKVILIEEVNKHKNRIAGKTLDGFHYVLMDRLPEDCWKRIKFIDSDGAKGWRSMLKLTFTAGDKKINKERKRLKINKLTKKHLAARIANHYYGLNLDVDKNTYDGDEADAIGMGIAAVVKGGLRYL